MKEFIEKLIGRLEKLKYDVVDDKCPVEKNSRECEMEYACETCYLTKAINIVNELAEECKSRIMIDNEYCWQKCSAVEHCKECSRLGNGTIDYFENYDSLIEEHKEKDCFNCSRRTWYQKGYADAMEHIKYINTPNDTTSSYCEWKIDGVYLMCQHKTELFISCLEEEKYRYKYCPICGKKIKVVE